MSKLNTLLEVERNEVGTREGANNDNKYGRAYGWNNVAWCVQFQWWCFEQAGVPFPKTAHCNNVEAYAKEHGQWVTKDFKVGDAVIFDYDLNGERDHIGLVVEVNGGNITTIEGNYQDMVAKVNRRASEFVGAYRPDYGEKIDIAEGDGEELNVTDTEIPNSCMVELPCICIGDVGLIVEILQTALHVHGFTPSGSRMTSGRFDGEFGNGTLTALRNFQRVNGIEDEDGFTGVDTWNKLIGGIG